MDFEYPIFGGFAPMRHGMAAALPFVCAAIFFTVILQWSWHARITNDEGVFLGVIQNFIEQGELKGQYIGKWGERGVVSTGPAVTVPLALVGLASGMRPEALRTFYYLFFCFVLLWSFSLLGLSRKMQAMAFVGFFLWVCTMPWHAASNPASLNLIANVFGEGMGLAWSLVALHFAAQPIRATRNPFWICALLALSSKILSLLLVFPGCGYLVYKALQKTTPQTQTLPKQSWPWFWITTGVFAIWIAFLCYKIGVDGIQRDLQVFSHWLSLGGGYMPGAEISFFNKWDQLEHSRVQPIFVLAVWILGCTTFALSKKSLKDSCNTLNAISIKLTVAGIALYLFWYLFFASRGWMRHQWLAFGAMGWLAATTAALSWESKRPSLRALAAFFVLLLTAVGLSHGALHKLILFSPEDTMKPQRILAQDLLARHPNASVWVADWHTAPALAFFLKKPQRDLSLGGIQRGDLILCDEESGCDPAIYRGFCRPQMTLARSGYCVY